MKLKATFATRRDKTFGHVGKHGIAADGTVEIPDRNEALRLIGTGNFAQADKDSNADKEDTPKDAMFITNGDQTIDLSLLNKSELLALARNDLEIEVDGRNGDRALRDAIFAHVNGL